MIQRRSKILPRCSVCAWIVRREQERQHINQTNHAGGTNQNAKHQRQANRKFSIRYQKRKKTRVRQHEVSQYRRDKWIRTLSKKTVDP